MKRNYLGLLLTFLLFANAIFAQSNTNEFENIDESATSALFERTAVNSYQVQPVAPPTKNTSYPYFESFESGNGIWTDVSGNDFNWTRKSGSTSSNSTGPNSAHNGTFYMYTEASSPNFPSKTSSLEGGFDFTNVDNPVLFFYYHMYGGNMGTLSIDIFDGTTWHNDFWTLTGQQQTSNGAAFKQAQVDIADFGGLDNVTIRFHAITGSGFTSDICIDQIEVDSFDGMQYLSSYGTQNNLSTFRDFTNQEILKVEVVTTGLADALSVTGFNFATLGTTNPEDILNARVFYTGTSDAFEPTNQFGSVINNPRGNFEITGSTDLYAGTNYFWLAYDVAETAATGNLLDAQINQINIAGVGQIPTETNPDGAVTIAQAPLFNSNVETIVSTVTSCDDTDTKHLVISNQGDEPLDFTAQVNNPQPWFSMTTTSAVLAAGESKNIEVNFNATGLPSGTLQGEINVSTNDPANLNNVINVEFTVEGNPIIAVPVQNIDFGNTFVSGSQTQTIEIENNSCGILSVSDIILSTDEFTTSETAFEVLPYDSYEVDVTFSPLSVDDFAETVTIISNDIDVVIDVLGTALDAPVIRVPNTEINTTAINCYDTVFEQFTVRNNGAADLELSVNATGGSDDYTWIDSDMPGGPVFEWFEISSLGTNTNLSGDDNNVSIDLPFGFKFYSETKTSFLASTNGYLTFGDEGDEYSNTELPDSDEPNDMIAPLWDDLNGGGDGELYYYYDANNNRFIIQYTDWPNLDNSGTYDFQIHLTPSGEIFYYYKNLNGNLNGSTIGIENAAGDEGVQVAYEEDYLHNDLAISISPKPNWLKLMVDNATVAPDRSITFNTAFIAVGLNAGEYTANIYVNSNDPVNPTEVIACTFNVPQFDPELEVSHSSLNLNEVYVGQTNSQVIEVINTGCEILEVSDISSNQSMFSTSVSSFNVPPRDTVEVVVSFIPTSIGSFNGELSILTNDGNSLVNVSGTGIGALISSVTTDKADGYYSEGETINFTLVYDQLVNVNTASGTPRITLNTTPATYANYTAGTGSTQLTFEYTVGSSEQVSILNYASIDALSLENGTILSNGYIVNLLLPNTDIFENAHNIVIDNTHPVATLSSVSDYSNSVPTEIVVIFSEYVSGLELSDFNMLNATVSNLKTVVEGLKYTVDLSSNIQGAYRIQLLASSVVDEAGNSNMTSNEVIIQHDTEQPTATITSIESGLTNASVFVARITFNEDITGFELNDLNLINATVSNLETIVAGQTFSVEIMPIRDGEVSIGLDENKVADLAGNGNAEASPFVITYEGSLPTVNFSTNVDNPTNQSPIDVTVDFSKVVFGFDLADVVVSNGTTNSLVEVITGQKYTFVLTPIADGAVILNMESDMVQDAAGNANEAKQFSFIYDIVGPTVVLNGPGTGITNESPFKVYVIFNKAVTGFELNDIVVANGTASNLVAITADKEYSVDITPTSEVTVTIDIPADVVSNQFGEGNSAATQLSIDIDNVIPTASLEATISSPTDESPQDIKVVFSKDMLNFSLSDISVVNGTASNLTEQVAQKEYSFKVYPIAEGEVSIVIAANALTDLGGNFNTASNTISFVYELGPPSVILSSDNTGITNSNLITVVAEFNELVTGFTLDNFELTNATASNLTEIVTGTKYSIEITPAADGELTINVPAGSVTDSFDNENTASNTISVIYDGTAPTVSISTNETSPIGKTAFIVNVVFSEQVAEFYLNDATVVNGNASNLSSSVASKEFSFKVTPVNNGDVSVSIAANIVTDLAGNSNSASNQIVLFHDAMAPVMSGLVVDNITENTTDVSVISNKNGELFYLVQLASNTAPSVDKVLAKKNASFVKDTELTLNIEELTANTEYTIYMVAVDNFENTSAISNISFTTLAPTGIVKKETVELAIYPNPNNGLFFIKHDNEDLIGQEIKILDITGQTVELLELVENKQQIDISSKPQGVYIIQVSTEDRIMNYRVIKR